MVKNINYLFSICPSFFSIIKSHLLEKLKKVDFKTEMFILLISLVMLALKSSKVCSNDLYTLDFVVC